MLWLINPRIMGHKNSFDLHTINCPQISYFHFIFGDNTFAFQVKTNQNSRIHQSILIVLPTNKATIGAIVLQKTNMERFRAPLSLGLVPVNVGDEQERVTNTLQEYIMLRKKGIIRMLWMFSNLKKPLMVTLALSPLQIKYRFIRKFITVVNS